MLGVSKIKTETEQQKNKGTAVERICAPEVFQGDFDRASVAMLDSFDSLVEGGGHSTDYKKLLLGFDFGTTNIVIAAMSEAGKPVAAVLGSSEASVRDGVILDYMGTLNSAKKAFERLRSSIGDDLSSAVGAVAYPPGIDVKTAKVFSNVLESLGFDCKGLYEEPTAAACALHLENAAIVDIGGGTTGITVICNGNQVYTADEPTGGTHMTLVLAGNQGISFEAAEKMKIKQANRHEMLHILKPVLEKMGTIVKSHLMKSGMWGKVPVILCGGGASLPHAEDVLSSVVEFPVTMAPHPLLVTPVGIVRKLWIDTYGDGEGK